MTPLDQWSDRAFSPIESVALARGPGTRRFAQNAFHTLLAVALLLAVIAGLCIAAWRMTP